MRLRSMIVVAAVIGAMPALAADPAAAPLDRLYACRAKPDAERLACFDTEVAALATAEQRHDVVVVDRAGIRQTRRRLFGLTLPDFNPFGHGGDDDKVEEVTELDATLGRAYQVGTGRWVFVLDDGARWVQTDDRPLLADPRAGDHIHIRRAALGSYLLNVNKQIAVRVQRENK